MRRRLRSAAGERLDQFLGGAASRPCSSPTWRRVPRVGSIVGIRTSDSRPRSKITESQRRGRHLGRVALAGSGRGSRRGCPPAASVIARRTASSVDQPLHRAAGDEPVVEALVHPHVGVLQVDQLQPRRVPGQPVALAVALQQPQLGRPVEPVRAAPCGSRASSSSTLPQQVEHLGGVGRRRRRRSCSRRAWRPSRSTPAACPAPVTLRPSVSVDRRSSGSGRG